VRDGYLCLQERNSSNAVTRAYAWDPTAPGGIGGLLEMTQSGQHYSYLYDGKGNVRAVVDSNQTVVAAYAYDPFGNLMYKSGTLEQPYLFSTKYYYGGFGLNYYGYRFYNPIVGKWMTRDPKGEVSDLNLYRTLKNALINFIDALGLDTYLVNRDLAVLGDSARSRYNPITHTFVVTTNPDGSITTYSWGNDANPHGWNLNQPLDIKTAKEALEKDLAEYIGSAELDKFIKDAFDQLKDPSNNHANGLVMNNCKEEAGNLIDLAKRLYFRYVMEH